MSAEFDRELDLPKVPALAKCRLSSVEDIWSAINVFQNQGWVYRGHADASWKLVTSLERHKPDAAREDELKAINDYRNETIGRIDYGDSLVDRLSSMQHYGTPTRLLDFSQSFFVALYFAFEKKDRDKFASSDRVLWALHIRQIFERSYPVKQHIELCKEFAVSQGVDPRLAHIVEEGERLLYDLHDDMRSQVERRIANDVLKKGTQKCGIIPVELPGNNNRLIAQKGLFLMPLSSCRFEENLKDLLTIQSAENSHTVLLSDIEKWIGSDDFLGVRFLIDDKLREDVIKLLLDNNITQSTVYPDFVESAGSTKYI